jgi:hypothetical protein
VYTLVSVILRIPRFFTSSTSKLNWCFEAIVNVLLYYKIK